MQVDLLRQVLSSKYPQLEIRSVDGFQGRLVKFQYGIFDSIKLYYYS